MVNKIIVKFKDGDIFLHKSEGNNKYDLKVLEEMIKFDSSETIDEYDDESSKIHSIELILS